MSLVTVNNLSLFLSGRDLFDSIGFQINPGDRIGLVGRNGSGKTTLLRLIVGEMSPDDGDIRRQKGIAMGYLPQDLKTELSGLLLPYILDSVPGRGALDGQLRRVEQALKETSDPAKQAILAEKLAEIHQHLDQISVRFPAYDAEKVLLGLGFAQSQFKAHISTLSGGWKMRAALAALLYRRPDVLLLDEPTNHLDIPSVRWLEKFLDEFPGAIVLVSHDSDFLNRLVRRIISLGTDGMRTYSGNYDFYLSTREQEKRALEAKARNQEQKIKEAKKFIERFRAKASKARQAQSKIKLVEKEALIQTGRQEKTMHFTFPPVKRSGKEVVSIHGLAKGFGEKFLYEGINLAVFRGDRVAVIGPNGCGKTTLLRMVARELPPDKGSVVLGHEVSMNYFAQHHSDMLSPRRTVMEEVSQAVPRETIGFVRTVCGSFLFSGEEVDKRIAVLSGGEKARVALAKLLVKPGNFMVMDEPTNHLDIASSEILTDALEKYEGTLLFVSHNQAFVNRLATKIWDIRSGGIEEYPGNLYEYYDHLARLEKDAASREQEVSHGKTGDISGAEVREYDRKAIRREKAEKRRLAGETLNPILKQLEDIEKKISLLEGKQEELETALADPLVLKDKEKSVPLMKEYHAVREDLESLLSQWEQLQEELAAKKRKLQG
jgi:ATP-binding cassette subfamily F protein 3